MQLDSDTRFFGVSRDRLVDLTLPVPEVLGLAATAAWNNVGTEATSASDTRRCHFFTPDGVLGVIVILLVASGSDARLGGCHRFVAIHGVFGVIVILAVS